MKLLFITPSLSSGGAERCAVLLMEEFSNRGYEVCSLTTGAKEKNFYSLSSNIKSVSLGLDSYSANIIQAVKSNLARVSALRKAIAAENPDRIITFLPETSVTTLLATKGIDCPVIVSEQNDPVKSLPSKVWQYLRKANYPLAAHVVSSSNGVNDYFDWLPAEKKTVIYNPLADISEDVSAEEQDLIESTIGSSKFSLAAMGRFTDQKGFDLLIEAFSKISSDVPDWNLTILGDGWLREDLVSMRDTLKLENRVFLPGRMKNPFAFLKRADLFVLSSRYEGFGNVIIEAMSCGLPVVSYDCNYGPNEIIEHGVNGLLVTPESVDELANSLKEIMLDGSKREAIALEAPKVQSRFSLTKIADQWEEIIK